MFYSHEILSNTKYGVATIWLAATVGKGTTVGGGVLRRLTRKAVQGVDVPRACETIIDPGAPLALRLQGSLLYGVSRVFAQQCSYVLSDAEKTQSDMMTFFRVLHTSETDPQAGKTRSHLITLQDDPNFDLLGALPSLHLLYGDKDLAGVPSQGSTNKFSQMTPGGRGDSSQGSLSSSRDRALLPLDLPSSSLCAGSYRLPSEFGHYSSPLAKHNRDSDAMPEFQPFVDDELDPINAIGLDFDADGNLVGILEPEPEPELPPLRDMAASGAQRVNDNLAVFAEAVEQPSLGGGEGQELGMGEAVLGHADAPPPRPATKQSTDSFAQTTETTETEEASAGNRRGRRRKLHLMLDPIHRISRAEFRSWSTNYAQNMDASRKRLKTATQTQAKKTALALLYGNSIAGVGNASGRLGVPHPLAEEFAGRALKARLQGLRLDEVDFGVKETRGRRRKSPEAFAEELAALEDEQRNVRRRVEDQDAELGRGAGLDGDELAFGDESAPELGLDPAPPLDDRHSSSMMPWSRPASAVRGQGSAQKAAPSPSPLHRQGSTLGAIDRHSDPVETPLGGAAGLGPQDSSSIDLDGSLGALDWHRGNATPPSGAAFDVASHEFLAYAAARARAEGVARDADDARRWIAFDELASPGTHTKAVAAQAFLHTLTLASTSAVAVAQDGAAENQPFGTIHIGVAVPREHDAALDAEGPRHAA